MSDAPDDTPVPRPKKGFAARLFKLVVLVGLLAATWIIITPEGKRALSSLQPPKESAETQTHHPASETLKEKDEQIDTLKDHIEQLDAKLRTLEDVVSSAPKPAAENSDTADKIEKMQSKIDALMQMPHAGSTVEDERVAHLEDTIGKQEESLRALQAELAELQARGTHDVTLITAYASLKDAVLRGSPYATQLSQLTPLVQDDKSKDMLSQLKPQAENGIATVKNLQADFAALLPKALSANKSSALERNLHSLIRIRKVGEQQKGSDDESILARAEARLARDDIDGSLKETALLSPPAIAVLAPWTAKAQDVVRTRTLMDSLQLALVSDKPVKTPSDIAPAAGKKPEAPKPEPVPAPMPESPKEEPKAEPDKSPEAKPDNAEQTKKPEALPETKPSTHSE